MLGIYKDKEKGNTEQSYIQKITLFARGPSFLVSSFDDIQR